MRPRALTAAAVGAGLLLTAGLPPFGWWPLALLGAAVLAALSADRALRGRLRIGVGAAIGFLAPGLFWMSEFTGPGYVLAVLLESALLTAGIAAAPPARARAVGFPAGLVLAEALRRSWPFGGVPIATIAQTQIGGPLAPAARLGGELLIVALVGLTGIAVAALARRAPLRAAPAALAVVAVAAGGFVAPHGRHVASLDAAVVQGGGPRGTRAVDTSSRVVFERHLDASAPLAGSEPLDVVLWPEDVVDVEGGVTDTPEGRELGALAAELGTTLVVGVVEGYGDEFVNLAVAWGPDGGVVDRYEKNQRVPFGEHIPFRSLVERVADVSAVPRDARVGHGPGLLRTPAGDLGVVISYEVFFARRARAALTAGAEILLVPTNASSFTTTQMPALELGAARLRALETGRYVLQAAPTGFSALVDPDGRVRWASDLGQPALLTTDVARRRGDTPYTRIGDGPLLAAAVLLLALAWGVGQRAAGPPVRPRAGA